MHILEARPPVFERTFTNKCYFKPFRNRRGELIQSRTIEMAPCGRQGLVPTGLTLRIAESYTSPETEDCLCASRTVSLETAYASAYGKSAPFPVMSVDQIQTVEAILSGEVSGRNYLHKVASALFVEVFLLNPISPARRFLPLVYAACRAEIDNDRERIACGGWLVHYPLLFAQNDPAIMRL